MGDQAVRWIAKYLTSFSQAPAQELHLSRNKISAEGIRWLIGCLAMHPAYPIWLRESQRYVPLRLSIDNSKVGLKGEAGYKLLEAACSSFSCAVCIGERYSEEVKHNGIIHLCNWEQPDGAVQLPTPAVHARPVFAPGRRAATKAPVTGAARDEPRIVYEDDDLAVVLKPAGWSCLPQPQGVDASWAKLKPLARRQKVAELLQQASNPPLHAWILLWFGGDPNCDASRDTRSDRGMVHRLDVESSGPILIGKTLKGVEHAKKQVVTGLLKDYVVLVHGTFSTERGECRAPIDTSIYADTKRVRVDPSGQFATTIWEALAEYEDTDAGERYTLVHCRMVTLRTHQHRVHMQYLGHPVVGDRLYGTGDIPAFCPRIFLHKFRIGFTNLKNQACIEACSLQSVQDLWKALGKLRKVGGMAMMGCGAPGL
jgi:23S rRNA-/tRNA-specific pseudouridylate synthase